MTLLALVITLAVAAPPAAVRAPAVSLAAVARVSPPPVRFFPLRDVRLLAGPFQEAQQRGLQALLRLDPERLLHSFRLNAGLPSAARPYGGWEKPDVELRGHTLGHYLSACALLYEATGDSRLRQRALAVVSELAVVQEALAKRGATPGYLSAFPESLIDRVEARQPVWAPYYTLHKVMAGLLDVYRTTGEQQALEVASRMADWLAARAARLDDRRWQAMLETEFGGMQESLTELHAATGRAEHLRLARLFDHRSVFDPLARGEDPLDGLHANTQIPKAIGAAADCELTGEPRYCAVARTFWQRVAQQRSYAIGGHSEDEHFSPTRALSRHLGESTAETCNSYNMLKLTRRLFGLRPEPAHMEFYERALLNHILASQDPATGAVTYYVSLRPGTYRTFSSAEDSFWCCVGTGLENPGRHAEAIYAREGETLLVNLFVASELRWSEKGLRLRQETSFPDEPRTRLVLGLDRPLRLALRLRRPAWAGDGFAVKVNGQPAAIDRTPGAFVSVEREWQDGDRVDVELPMSLRFEPMPDDPSVAALAYGPVVLAADLGAQGLDDARRYGPTAPDAPLGELPAIPALVAASAQEALDRIRPEGAALEFRTQGLGRPADVVLKPFFRLADRRYTVYFRRLSEGEWTAQQAAATARAAAARALEQRTVDVARCGDDASESAHALEQGGAADSGWFEGRRYRSTRSLDGFSYRLAVPSAGPVALRAEYWGGEDRRRCFEVLVDGEVIARQQLFDDRPGEVHAVEYPLPEPLVRGRDRVRAGLRPCRGGSIGAVFELRTVRPPD